MSLEVSQELQKCINTCEKLKGNMEREKNSINNCLSGELMKQYIEAADETKKAISRIENQLSVLQASSQMEP